MSKSNLLGKVVHPKFIQCTAMRLGAPAPLGAPAISFTHDFAVLHFGLFSDQIFQLLAQFLMDFPKVCIMYLPMCIPYD